jgi:predicted DNA-binding ribbon-helix-helix protein
MKSPVIKRSIDIAGRRTSVCLEEPFWSALKEIASARNTPLNELVAIIDAYRQPNCRRRQRPAQDSNLSSAVRLFVLGFYRDQISDREGGTQEPLGRLSVGL